MINKNFFRHAIGVVAAGMLCPELAAQVNISVTSGLAYSQNFDGLNGASSGAWTDNSTLVGWYAKSQSSEWSNNTDNFYVRPNGTTSTTDDFYANRSSGSDDEALGAMPGNGSDDMAIGLLLKNDTTEPLTQLHVMFRGEQWSDQNSNDQTLTFGYQVFSTAALAAASNLNPGTAGGSGGWVAVSGLNFTSPDSANANAYQDGNAAGNFQLKNVAFNVTIPAGQFIMLRWRRNNDNNNDNHMLAIDDVFVAVPEAGTWAAGALMGAAALVGYRRSRRTVA
jgi:hypothetical protein